MYTQTHSVTLDGGQDYWFGNPSSVLGDRIRNSDKKIMNVSSLNGVKFAYIRIPDLDSGGSFRANDRTLYNLNSNTIAQIERY